MVLRAGFARTIYQARQAVSHGHIRVNGKRVDKPSYRLRPGQAVEIANRSKNLLPFAVAASGEPTAIVPAYLAVDRAALRARLERLPTRAEFPRCATQDSSWSTTPAELEDPGGVSAAHISGAAARSPDGGHG